MKTTIKKLIKLLQMYEEDREVSLQDMVNFLWNSRFITDNNFKCQRCKEEHDDKALRHIHNLTEDLFGKDEAYDKIFNNYFSFFLRTEKGIDGIEKICNGCVLDLKEEFEKWWSEQREEIGLEE